MKLNKPTMQYIRSLIANKANENTKALRDEIAAIEKPYIAKRNAYIEAIKSVIENAREKLESLVTKYGYEDCDIWGWHTRKINVRFYDDVGITPTEEDKECLNLLRERIEKVNAAVETKYNEIIAKMTLGGDAADLAKLIDEIEF